jgi:hypothetical protein
MKRGIAAALLVALAACSNEPEGVPVDMQQRVAAMGDDCRALQDEFDSTTDSEVMRYIDAAMRDAGCY